jgi:hypothetical protein
MASSQAHFEETLPSAISLMPRRSALFCLEPIGCGTALTESLTSYMARLSQEHSIAVNDLISSRLMVGFAREYLLSPQGTRSSSWSRCSRAINGVGVWARDAVCSLESLVWRSDLRYLTVLPWADVIPARGLLKRSREWCPACYREWQENGTPIYDPLIWFLKPVRICLRHQRELDRVCPQCSREIPCLSSQVVPGFCPHCGSPLWVMTGDTPRTSRLDPRCRRWQAWIADELGEMFAEIARGTHAPRRAHLQAFFQSCAESVFAGSSSETARLVQVSPRTMREWIAGSQLPTLENLLVSCYCFNTSTTAVLFGTAESPSLAQVRMPLWLGPRQPGRPPRMLDKDAIRLHLQEVIDANYLFPPSMVDTSRFLGIDASHLMRLFPGLCKEISQRYRSHASCLRTRALARTTDNVRSIVRVLHSNGVYPGYDPVSSRLPRPWAMRSHDVTNAWKSSLQELALADPAGAFPPSGWEDDDGTTQEAHEISPQACGEPRTSPFAQYP